MDKSGLKKLPFDSTSLPEDWVVVPDREEGAPIFIALPKWLFSKMKNEEYVSESDFSRYTSEVGDLIIDHHLNNE